MIGRARGGGPEPDNAQEKVETPAARIARDVRTETAVETAPTLVGMYVAQGEPYAPADAALGSARRHLKLDLEQIERVHAEHRGDARADPGKRVVLQNQKKRQVSGRGVGHWIRAPRTIACVGKKLGCE